jgi:hypothetical protein
MAIPAAGIVDLVAPEGKLLRVLAIRMPTSGTVEGDQAFVTISRGGDLLATIGSPPMIAATDTIQAALGLNDTQPRQSTVVVATGIVEYDQTATAICMALPDVWWPFSIRITLSTTSAAIQSGTVVYERGRID